MNDLTSFDDIVQSAHEAGHRVWNLLLLFDRQYRPTSSFRCEEYDFGEDGQEPTMPQAFHYYYARTTADNAIADIRTMVENLGESADLLYTVDDLAEKVGTARFVIKLRLNVGWQNPNAECAWPVMFTPNGEPLFDGVVLELLRRREGKVASC